MPVWNEWPATEVMKLWRERLRPGAASWAPSSFSADQSAQLMSSILLLGCCLAKACRYAGSNWSVAFQPGNGEKKCALPDVWGAAPQTAVPTVLRPSVRPTPAQTGLQAWAEAPATICTQIDGAISGYTTSGALARFEQMEPPAVAAVCASAFLSMARSYTTCRPFAAAACKKPAWASSKLAVLPRSMPTFVLSRTFLMYCARSDACAL